MNGIGSLQFGLDLLSAIRNERNGRPGARMETADGRRKLEFVPCSEFAARTPSELLPDSGGDPLAEKPDSAVAARGWTPSVEAASARPEPLRKLRRPIGGAMQAYDFSSITKERR